MQINVTLDKGEVVLIFVQNRPFFIIFEAGEGEESWGLSSILGAVLVVLMDVNTATPDSSV